MESFTRPSPKTARNHPKFHAEYCRVVLGHLINRKCRVISLVTDKCMYVCVCIHSDLRLMSSYFITYGQPGCIQHLHSKNTRHLMFGHFTKIYISYQGTTGTTYKYLIYGHFPKINISCPANTSHT